MKLLLLQLSNRSVQYILIATFISAAFVFNEQVTQSLMYSRQDILNGDIWRMITAHFIHMNFMHWLLNAGGVLLALYLFYDVEPSDWIVLSLLSSLGISIMMLALEPNVGWYVGFSGVLHAWFIYGGLATLQKRRWLEAMIILVVFIAKITWEQIEGPSVLSEQLIQGNVLVNAHFYGAILGGVFSIKLLMSKHR